MAASALRPQGPQLLAPYWYANAQSRFNLQFLFGNSSQISESGSGKRAAGDFFFFPAPGQTGKINLALVTEDTHPFPKAFFGLNRKTEGGQVKILISPFAEDQEGEKGQAPFTNCCS